MRFQFSPSRNATRIIHDDGRVEMVQGQVGPDGGVSSAPVDGQFYDPAAHPTPQHSATEAAVYGAADGITARHTDEIGAAIDTAGDYLKGDLGGVNPAVKDVLTRYRQRTNQNRVELDRMRKQHQDVSLASEVGGGLIGAGKLRGPAGAVAAGAAYGHGDSTGQDFGQVAEDAVKGGIVGGALGYVGGKVAPKVGAALEKGAYKGLNALAKPAVGRRLTATVGVGNAVGTGIGGLIGGPVGGMVGSAVTSAVTPRIAKGVSGLAQKGATAMEHAAARRQLSQPHAILTHENPRFPPTDPHPSSIGLRNDIREAGGRPQNITGRYDSPDVEEHAKLAMGLSPEAAARLGKNYGQESVVASGGGNNAMIYSNGPDAGKAILGKGTTIHEKQPEQFYSTMKNPLSGKDTHFTHNLDFDAGPQTFSARSVSSAAKPTGVSAGGAVSGAMAASGGGATDTDPQTRANTSVRQKLAARNGQHLHDKMAAGKLSQPSYIKASQALKWISYNVQNPYFAKQAMDKVMEDPNSAETIVDGLQQGMQQRGEQEHIRTRGVDLFTPQGR